MLFVLVRGAVRVRVVSLTPASIITITVTIIWTICVGNLNLGFAIRSMATGTIAIAILMKCMLFRGRLLRVRACISERKDYEAFEAIYTSFQYENRFMSQSLNIARKSVFRKGAMFRIPFHPSI